MSTLWQYPLYFTSSLYEIFLPKFFSLHSELHFFIKQRRAIHFAWLSGAGIYHGGLNFGATHRWESWLSYLLWDKVRLLSFLLFVQLVFSLLSTWSLTDMFLFLHSSHDGDENFVENKALLNYSKLSEGSEALKPSSLAVSEFHFLLLMGNKVKVCISGVLIGIPSQTVFICYCFDFQCRIRTFYFNLKT